MAGSSSLGPVAGAATKLTSNTGCVSDVPALRATDAVEPCPVAAIRMKIQRHSGPQERIDLSFSYPSLEPADAPKHVSAETVVEEAVQPIDRIFLSIAAHHDTMAPDALAHTIYPRYLDQASTPAADGLAQRAFRDGTPYSGEDLFLADAPRLTARCSRDRKTA